MNSINLKEIDIFSPYIILFAILLYILLAAPAFYYQIRGLQPPSINVYIYIIFGALFFIIGTLLPKLLQKISWKQYLSHVLFGKKEALTELKEPKTILTPKLISNLEIVVLAIVIFGLILQSLNLFNVGGIPLLSGYLKAKAVTKVWIVSYLLFLPGINLLLAKFNRRSYYILFLVGIILFALTGYRTTTIVIILSVFITLYYTREFKWSYYLIFILGLLVLGLAVGYIAVKSIEWQQWALNPFELFFYRAGYTLTVFDKLIGMQGSTHGELFYYSLTGFFKANDPRAIVGEVVLGYRHSTTSTIFGPVLLDFGTWALALQMFLMGLVLQLMYLIQKNKKGIFTAFYAVILAQTLVWIETGPTDLVVWIFYLISIILIIAAFLKYGSYNALSEKIKHTKNKKL